MTSAEVDIKTLWKEELSTEASEIVDRIIGNKENEQKKKEILGLMEKYTVYRVESRPRVQLGPSLKPSILLAQNEVLTKIEEFTNELAQLLSEGKHSVNLSQTIATQMLQDMDMVLAQKRILGDGITNYTCPNR